MRSPALVPAQPRRLLRRRIVWVFSFGLMLAIISTACGSSEPTSSETANDSTGSTAALDSNNSDDPSSSEALSDAPEPLADTTPPADQGETSTSAPAPNPAAGYGNELALANERTNWTGVIGVDIAFDMWLTQAGDFVAGEITYRSVGEPITLLGSRAMGADWYFLEEYGVDGKVSGYLTLGSVENGIVTDSTWGELPLVLEFVDTASSDDAFDRSIVPGIYEASHAPFLDDGGECCGPTDRLMISAVTSDTVAIEFENLTGGPGYNAAYVARTIVPLRDNVASYVNEAEGADCAFDVHLFDGFAFVTHVDDRFDCQFGNAAGVEGSYLLTTPYVAQDDSPFFGETLDFASFGPISLGDTWQSLTDRFGVRPHDRDLDDTLFNECTYVRLENDPLSPWLMMLGDGDESVVSRIEIGDPRTRTTNEVGVGSTEAEVRLAYDNAISERPHQYLGEGAKYLRVTSNKTDREVSTILFETDEDGIVTSMRNGFSEPIDWIEGCA